MTEKTKTLGKKGEDIAAAFLEKKDIIFFSGTINVLLVK